MTPSNGSPPPRCGGIRHPLIQLVVVLLVFPVGMVACSDSYGRLSRSNAISRIFESHEVLPDHNYYTTGPQARPTAILAIHRSYKLKSGLWRSVEMTTPRLKHAVDAMTDQLGFTPGINGSAIINPEGLQVGIWYSHFHRTTIRFEPATVIVVSQPRQRTAVVGAIFPSWCQAMSDSRIG